MESLTVMEGVDQIIYVGLAVFILVIILSLIYNGYGTNVNEIQNQYGVTLTAMASAGIPPYTYQWYTGGTCTSAIAGQTQQSYNAGSTVGTFSVRITDADSETVCESTST